MKRIRIHVLLLIGLSFASAAVAMDRWAALSMIESGNDDRAVGSSGEITRFQIRHDLLDGKGHFEFGQIAMLFTAVNFIHHPVRRRVFARVVEDDLDCALAEKNAVVVLM